MIPSKRPLTLKPLPTTSQPKALLAKKPLPVAAKAASVSAPKSPGVKAPRQKKDRPRWVWAVAIAVFLLVGVGGAYAMGFIGHRNKMAQIHDLQAKLEDPNASRDDKRAAWGQMNDAMRGLPEDQRQALREEGQEKREMRGDSRTKKFFAMSAEDQMKELDKTIDDMLKRQKERDDQNGTKSDGKGAPGGGDNSGDQGGRRGRGGGAPDPTQPNAGHDRRLSSTTGEHRADMHEGREMRTVYKNMLNARAAQRGVTLPQGGMGRGGFGGGGRRG